MNTFKSKGPFQRMKYGQPAGGCMGKEKLTKKGRWSVSEWDLGKRENGGLKEKGKCTIKGEIGSRTREC